MRDSLLQGKGSELPYDSQKVNSQQYRDILQTLGWAYHKALQEDEAGIFLSKLCGS